MRKAAPFLLLLLFIVLLVAPSGIRYFQYNAVGAVAPATPPAYDPASITAVSTPIASNFQDDPQRGDGMVLLDMAHDNQFEMDDIGYLNGRLSARGYTIQPYESGSLATALRAASAYVVITPITPFNRDEVQAVEEFVARGGRLLMIGDPTRYGITFEETDFSFDARLDTDKIPLNSLASSFDILYNDDYLYNTLENEGNFRNILLPSAGYAEDGLVDGLDQIAFYGSHSLQTGSASKAIITADDDTWSSATDRAGGLVVAASGADGSVVALGDIQFLSEPYYTVYDNNEFISRIADFLAAPLQEHQLALVDFPYFYQDQVDLHYLGNPELGSASFDGIVALQDAFATAGKALALTAVVTPDNDIIHVGLYNQADDVSKILSSAGITLTIDPPVLTADEAAALAAESDSETAVTDDVPDEIRLLETPLGNFQMAGSSMILWYEEGGQNQVILLAASSEGVDNGLNRLVDHMAMNSSLDDGCLLNETLAICPSGVADEVMEAEYTSAIAATTDSGSTDDGNNDTGIDGGINDGPLDSTDLSGYIDQGDIFLDETLSAELAAGEGHRWSFSGGPATIDITVVGGETLDVVLELYDPNDVYVTSADSTLLGETETLTAVSIEEGTYSIIVTDFYGEAGSYTLNISSATAPEASTTGDGRIFIYADDNGEALDGGFTSVAAFDALLSPVYDVTVWSATDDGSLTADMLTDYDLLIWDSGDYYDETGFLDDDTLAIFDYIDNNGDLFITGSAPTLISGFTEPIFASVSDIVINGNDDILLAGFGEGDNFPIDPPLTTLAVSDSDMDLSGSTAIPLFLRGEASEEAGLIAAVAIVDELSSNSKLILMMIPFSSMPTAVQADMMDNFMAWYEM